MAQKRALIAGSTGLIGKELLAYLLEGSRYDRVTALVRKPLGLKHHKLEEVLVDFNQLDEYREHFAVDDVFCTLGTTIKKAKTKETMKIIDVDYPVEMAKLAKEMGATQFLVVSSMNANYESPIWYSRMKGELEKELSSIGLNSLQIFRPSLLLGDRQEFRLGEKMAAVLSGMLSFVFVGKLRKYKAIQAKTVAKSMYRVAGKFNAGIAIYASHEIEDIARD